MLSLCFCRLYGTALSGAAAGQQRLIRRQLRVIQGGWQGLAASDAAIGLGPRNLPV